MENLTCKRFREFCENSMPVSNPVAFTGNIWDCNISVPGKDITVVEWDCHPHINAVWIKQGDGRYRYEPHPRCF